MFGRIQIFIFQHSESGISCWILAHKVEYIFNISFAHKTSPSNRYKVSIDNIPKNIFECFEWLGPKLNLS